VDIDDFIVSALGDDGSEGASPMPSGEAAALAPELERIREGLTWDATWDEAPEAADAVVAAIQAEQHQSTAPASAAGASTPAVGRARRAWRMPALGAAAAAAVVVLVLLVAGGRTTSQVTVDLAGTERAAGASGEAELADADGGWRVDLRHELPAAPADAFYEAWVEGPSGYTSIGTFRGGEAVVLWSGVDLRVQQVLVITLEPDDGDPAVSTAAMLRGTIDLDP
jgi:hypothetical protein